MDIVLKPGVTWTYKSNEAGGPVVFLNGKGVAHVLRIQRMVMEVARCRTREKGARSCRSAKEAERTFTSGETGCARNRGQGTPNCSRVTQAKYWQKGPANAGLFRWACRRHKRKKKSNAQFRERAPRAAKQLDDAGIIIFVRRFTPSGLTGSNRL